MIETENIVAYDTGLVVGSGERHYTFGLKREGFPPQHIWNQSYKDEDDPPLMMLLRAFQDVYEAGFLRGLGDQKDD